MTKDLLGCPLEVLLNITSFLDTPSYGMLRRTCSTIEKELFDDFAKEFFTTKQFMISSFSLNALLDISKHPTLSTYLRKIIIGLDIIIPSRSIRPATVLNHPPLHPSLDDLIHDQDGLLETAFPSNILAMAFRNLPNCHAVEVRDFESRTKERDSGLWRSYGKKIVEDAHGTTTFGRPQRYAGGDRAQLFPSITFNHVISAIAISGLSCTSLGLITRLHYNAIKHPAFYIPSCVATTCSQSFHNVTSFAIALMCGRHNTNDSDEFLQFLKWMPNLHTLRVNGSGESSRGPYFEVLEQYLALASIKRLELGKTGINEQELLDLLSHLSKVEALVFFRVRVNSGQWNPILQKLFSLPTLSFVRFDHLRQTGLRGVHHLVSFKESKDSDDKPELLHPFITCESTSNMRDALLDGIARFVLRDEAWSRKHYPEPSDDEEENGDDSDDDSEMVDIAEDELINEGGEGGD